MYGVYKTMRHIHKQTKGVASPTVWQCWGTDLVYSEKLPSSKWQVQYTMNDWWVEFGIRNRIMCLTRAKLTQFKWQHPWNMSNATRERNFTKEPPQCICRNSGQCCRRPCYPVMMSLLNSSSSLPSWVLERCKWFAGQQTSQLIVEWMVAWNVRQNQFFQGIPLDKKVMWTEET